jgi:hypothetical protein
VKPCGDPELKYPITGVCCARAASGHAAAPPSSAMKSRRFIALTQTQGSWEV